MKKDVAGVFVGREAVFDERADVVGAGVVVGSEYDRGGDLFAECLVGDADDGGFEYGGVLVEDFLDFAWVDVKAAADDQFFLRSTMKK